MLNTEGRPVDLEVSSAVRLARHHAMADVGRKAWLAQLLAVDSVALANEGLAVHRRAKPVLLQALEIVSSGTEVPDYRGEWRFVSPSDATREMIKEAGAIAMIPADTDTATFLSFSPIPRQHPDIDEIPT